MVPDFLTSPWIPRTARDRRPLRSRGRCGCGEAEHHAVAFALEKNVFQPSWLASESCSCGPRYSGQTQASFLHGDPSDSWPMEIHSKKAVWYPSVRAALVYLKAWDQNSPRICVSEGAPLSELLAHIL